MFYSGRLGEWQRWTEKEESACVRETVCKTDIDRERGVGGSREERQELQLSFINMGYNLFWGKEEGRREKKKICNQLHLQMDRLL